MPSSSHTPGPWRSDGEGVEGKAFDGSWRWITERIRGGTPGERIANARLIAAAPELLEAARLTAQHFERMNLHPDVNFMGDDEHEAWGALRAAIAKATGDGK